MYLLALISYSLYLTVHCKQTTEPSSALPHRRGDMGNEYLLVGSLLATIGPPLTSLFRVSVENSLETSTLTGNQSEGKDLET